MTGIDNNPILRVDGPHAAPTMHYDNYDDVMIIGAGIGLTPGIRLSLCVYVCFYDHLLFLISVDYTGTNDLSLSLTHTHTLSLSLSHTHTHSHSFSRSLQLYESGIKV